LTPSWLEMNSKSNPLPSLVFDITLELGPHGTGFLVPAVGMIQERIIHSFPIAYPFCKSRCGDACGRGPCILFFTLHGKTNEACLFPAVTRAISQPKAVSCGNTPDFPAFFFNSIAGLFLPLDTSIFTNYLFNQFSVPF